MNTVPDVILLPFNLMVKKPLDGRMAGKTTVERGIARHWGKAGIEVAVHNGNTSLHCANADTAP